MLHHVSTYYTKLCTILCYTLLLIPYVPDTISYTIHKLHTLHYIRYILLLIIAKSFSLNHWPYFGKPLSCDGHVTRGEILLPVPDWGLPSQLCTMRKQDHRQTVFLWREALCILYLLRAAKWYADSNIRLNLNKYLILPEKSTWQCWVKF